MKKPQPCCPNKNTALCAASAIFALVGILHLLRLLYGIEVLFGKTTIPPGPSLVGFIIASGLSYWMWKASRH